MEHINDPSQLAPDNKLLTAIAIHNGTYDDDDIEYLCSVTVEAPDYHFEEDRDLILMRGGIEAKSDSAFSVYGSDRQRIMVTDDPAMAIGSYLHLCDIHSIPEDDAHDGVAEGAGNIYQAYRDHRDTQTLRDRRLSLLDQAEQDSKIHPLYLPVLNHDDARWRNTGLDTTQEHRVTRFIERHEPNPKFCYKNTRRAIEEWWNDDRVQYVEGIAIPKEGFRIIGHAWLEIEGVVAELTLPWNRPNPHGTGAVYYGVEVPRHQIEDATKDLAADDDPGPIVLNPTGGKLG